MPKKIVIKECSTDFRSVMDIVEFPLPETLASNDILVQNRYIGINASDINFSAGSYMPGVKPPFDCGFEAVGTVVSVGDKVTKLKKGDYVVTLFAGAFAEFQVLSEKRAKQVPSLSKDWLVFDLSGTTASISLAELLKPKKGEVAIVTAALGGTGHIAVQLLKNVYECKVVGVCSSEKKAEKLRSLGCDVVISSTTDLSKELKQACPGGAHIAYESVGGATLDAVIENLALKGRILSIGSITNYKDRSGSSNQNPIPLELRLLKKSATLHTFLLPYYAEHSVEHFSQLCQLAKNEKLKACIDSSSFTGLESVPDAIDHMYARKNLGKIVVEI